MLREHGFANEDADGYVKVRTRRKEDFHFINVDLELASSENVQPLVKELGENISAYYCSDIDEIANLALDLREIKGVDFYNTYNDENEIIGSVDIYISEFCNLLENLSEESRRIWKGCHRKEVDIGFQAGNTPKSFQTQIRTETIKRCGELGATILITVYPNFNFEYRRKEDLKKKK